MEKPDYLEQFITYCIVIALAAFAGVVKAIRKYQKVGNEMTLKTLLIKASGDIVISIFAGLMMFFLLQHDAGQLTFKAAFYISMAAYMGSQAIDVFTAIWQAVVKVGNNHKG